MKSIITVLLLSSRIFFGPNVCEAKEKQVYTTCAKVQTGNYACRYLFNFKTKLAGDMHIRAEENLFTTGVYHTAKLKIAMAACEPLKNLLKAKYTYVHAYIYSGQKRWDCSGKQLPDYTDGT